MEVLQGHGVQRADLDDARVVDEHVHAAPVGGDLLRHRLHLAPVAYVARDRSDLTAPVALTSVARETLPVFRATSAKCDDGSAKLMVLDGWEGENTVTWVPDGAKLVADPTVESAASPASISRSAGTHVPIIPRRCNHRPDPRPRRPSTMQTARLASTTRVE